MSDDKMREVLKECLRLLKKTTLDGVPLPSGGSVDQLLEEGDEALTQQPESEPVGEVVHCYDHKGRDSIAFEVLDYRPNPGDKLYASPQPSAQVPEGLALVPKYQCADDVVTALYRRFKQWSEAGFGPDDVTWCEVKADVMALINDAAPSIAEKAPAKCTNRPSIAEKPVGPIYTCRGKGGRYEYLGGTIGAGKSRGETVQVYRDCKTGQLFHRDHADFTDRMELIEYP